MQGIALIADAFVAETEETLLALSAAIDCDARSEVELLAHRAGGASAACGAGRLSALLHDLEEMAHGGAIEGARPLYNHVAEEFSSVQTFLDRVKQRVDVR